MFDMKGVRKITPDERTFALCFARTMSVRRSCAAAGFERRTSFARASRLLERGDVQRLVRASILDDTPGFFPAGDAGPAPVGVVGEAADADNAPVSLENVRESRCADGRSGAPASVGQSAIAPVSVSVAQSARTIAPESGDQSASPRSRAPEAQSEKRDPSHPVPRAPDTGVPAPNAAGDPDERGEPALSLEAVERRILSEYEKIAFADASKESDVKIADKLRALDQYRAIVERQAQRLADVANAGRRSADERLTVVYDYGDDSEPTDGRETLTVRERFDGSKPEDESVAS